MRDILRYFLLKTRDDLAAIRTPYGWLGDVLARIALLPAAVVYNAVICAVAVGWMVWRYGSL